MLALAALTLKKTITLFALVGPLSMIPIFLSAASSLDVSAKLRFARTVALAVTVALLIAAFLGMPLLSLLGVSMGAMQVGGAVIVLLLAIAMVLGKETTFKGSPPPLADEGIVREASIIPLAVPLLAGPAAFSYVMANAAWRDTAELMSVILPIAVTGLSCWIIFRAASRAERQIGRSTLDLVERVGGFILAAIAVEMMATGLRGLFPVLGPV
ncbi:MAG TPA: MarC family protein [Rhodocyclaceae bacterium]|nr:MarC family protein [Rhodocyclaceae bacterium]